MSDEVTPPGPPRFPPVEDQSGPPDWPAPGQGGYPPPAGYGGLPGYPPGTPGGGHWLHPLTVGRAFSSALRLYRLRWRPMLGAILAVTVPVTIVTALVQGFVVGPALETWFNQYMSAIRAGDLSTVSLPPAQVGLTYLLAIVSGVFGMVANAAVIHIVDANYRGSAAGAMDGLRAAFGRLWSLVGILLALIGAFIAVGLIGGLAITVLAIAGAAIGDAGLAVLFALIGVVSIVAAIIFIALRWSLAPQAVMVEHIGVGAALGRSWRLVNGSTWRLLGYLLLVVLVLIVFTFIASILITIVTGILFGLPVRSGASAQLLLTASPLETSVTSLLSALLSSLVTPWLVTLLTLFYFDLRWRRGEPTTAPAPAPAAAS